MKKSKVLMICLILCLAALAAGAVLVFSGSLGITYANAEQYTAGETTVTSAVEALDVHWTSGNVRIEYHAGDGIRVSETAGRGLSADEQLRWWLDGGTLRIQYAKSGWFSLFNTLQKTLTVSLPEGTVLKSAAVTVSSADVNVTDLSADEISLSASSGSMEGSVSARKLTAASSSGAISLRTGGVTDVISLSASSGNLALSSGGAAGSVSLSTSSGTIRADLESAQNVEAGSSSGSITLNLTGSADRVKVHASSGTIRTTVGVVNQADLSSSSGNITVQAGAFGSLSVSTSSGGVKAFLPAEPGFTCTVSTSSGSFESGIPMAHEGKTYTCGDGSKKCSITTSSGDIRIDPAQ